MRLSWKVYWITFSAKAILVKSGPLSLIIGCMLVIFDKACGLDRNGSGIDIAGAFDGESR